ncbi:hypothetical protein [Bacteroides sp. 51]|uniref:hypothetical protein n=1 Tax=Bacteroides sp. 51 TaxID=2302938 RepID=UPI0013D2BD4F|nr:hypothetical protein [Bacteroides sp. 51]
MPNVYLELTLIDRILEGLAILFTVAAWILATVVYFGVVSPPSKLFVSPIAMTVAMIVFLWASRAPIRFYNFPVKLNERNYVMQYFIATRFTRVVSLIICLMSFCGLFMELEWVFGMTQGFFQLMMHIVLGVLLLSFVFYYIFAFRNR